jgi:hypothetical protein
MQLLILALELVLNVVSSLTCSPSTASRFAVIVRKTMGTTSFPAECTGGAGRGIGGYKGSRYGLYAGCLFSQYNNVWCIAYNARSCGAPPVCSRVHVLLSAVVPFL